MALNPAQQQAVVMQGHCLVTACPGSGKTTVLKMRAAHILRSDPNATLCAVTFTSDAANELKERILHEIPEAEDRVIAGTFHALAMRQLREASKRIALITDTQQRTLVRSALMEVHANACREGRVDIAQRVGSGGEKNVGDAMQYIGALKSMVAPILPSPDEEPMVLVYETYQGMLLNMGAMDFSDLIIHAVREMHAGELPRMPVTHLLVDEAQDVDATQLAWVLEHARQGVLTTVVGDDDQAIYGWRGAGGLESLLEFREKTGAAHVALNMSYRCPREVLEPAAQLIQLNTRRVEKALVTANRAKGNVLCQGFGDEEAEIEGAIETIEGSPAHMRWGILARNNRALERYELTLRSRGFNVLCSGGTPFWESPRPALFLAALEGVVTMSMVHLSEVLRRIGTPSFKVNDLQSYYRAHEHGAAGRWIRDERSFGREADTLRKRVREWSGQLKGKPEAQALAIHAIGEFIASYGNFFDGVKLNQDKLVVAPNGSVREPTKKELVMIARAKLELKRCAESVLKMNGPMHFRIRLLRNSKTSDPKAGEGPLMKEDGEPDIEKDPRAFQKLMNLKRPAVTLMTMHSSKGLEFDGVWIARCEMGVVPSKSGDLEEERRLMYVAMTRSMSMLRVAYVNKTDPDTGKTSAERSRFIDESGVKRLWSGTEPEGAAD